MALGYGYPELATKSESYEICFVPDNDYRGFLKRRVEGLEEKVAGGNFVDKHGQILGQHKGYPFYTVGQRKGLDITFGKPVYVTAIRPETNTVVLGDESGYTVSENQKMKMAAIEAMWETEPAPASFTLFGLPDVKARETHAAIRVPWVMGLIGTRSIDQPIPGIAALVDDAKIRIADGIKAYDAMLVLRENKGDEQAKAILAAHDKDMGYALLLKRFMDDPRKATPADIQKAADSTIPNVPVLFWSFRIMVACGMYFIFLFGYAFWRSSTRRLDGRGFLKVALWSLPLPWVAAELGWVVAEYGRQPWAIEGVLPTALGASSLSAGQIWISLGGFVLFYTALAFVDGYLMLKFARKGPDGLGMWPKRPDGIPVTAQTV